MPAAGGIDTAGFIDFPSLQQPVLYVSRSNHGRLIFPGCQQKGVVAMLAGSCHKIQYSRGAHDRTDCRCQIHVVAVVDDDDDDKAARVLFVLA